MPRFRIALVNLVLVLAAGRLLAAEPAPLTELPYSPSLDLTSLDRTVDPCVDFFKFSCGGWIQRNPIPADQSRWDVYSKMADENQQFLWGMLAEAAKPRPERSPAERLTGDFFASCMDEATIEKQAAKPLADDEAAIDRLTSTADLPTLLARFHRRGAGYPFGFGSNQDYKDAERTIAWAFAGGLGLPDRDYYFKDDPKSKEIRERYVRHVGTMLGLSGEAPPRAAEDAATVMRIETALAKARLTRVERRDPHATDHPMTLAELEKLTPSFSWSAYLAALGVPEVAKITALNVTEPKFFAAFQELLQSESIANWRTYLRWHLLRERAAELSKSYVEADFDFYGRYLRGAQVMQPRWKRCVRAVDRELGEALGQVFVAKVFSPATKAAAADMVERIEKRMGERLAALDWMSPATKQAAAAKLAAMRNKIGYPEKWRDYSSVTIDRADFAGNVARTSEFENRRQLQKIGKPLDRGEWGMTPPTVNAYYNPQMNDINFPAGVLEPPLFDPRLDDAPSYGDTGATIGHELTHGFDDEGRQFDAHGNLRDWWAPEDEKRFKERAQCVVDQYAQYVVVDDIKINSKLTEGEDIADLGGTILAYEAWQGAEKGKSLSPIDGFTPDQRFFIGFAQWACGAERPENARLNAATNPHSPLSYRINGVVVNMPEFAAAFACKPGQPMVKDPAKICRIW